MSKNIFTKQGIQEIAKLIQETKDEIIEKGKKVVQARLGNEQAEISEAILEEIAVNYDLDKLERLLSSAILIEPHKNKNLVDFGDKVEIELNGEKLSVTLTGNYLRKNNEITINSPLGNSIFAKAKGEEFKFKVGKQESKGIIKEITKSEEKNKQEERNL